MCNTHIHWVIPILCMQLCIIVSSIGGKDTSTSWYGSLKVSTNCATSWQALAIFTFVSHKEKGQNSWEDSYDHKACLNHVNFRLTHSIRLNADPSWELKPSLCVCTFVGGSQLCSKSLLPALPPAYISSCTLTQEPGPITTCTPWKVTKRQNDLGFTSHFHPVAWTLGRCQNRAI